MLRFSAGLALLLGTLPALPGCQKATGQAQAPGAAGVQKTEQPTEQPQEIQGTKVARGTATAGADSVGRRTFGAPLGEGQTLPLAQLLQRPDAFKEKNIIVSGQVRAACERKGCWMELVGDSDGDNGQGCRITFKDYGFFVPTDAKGYKARVEGVVAVKDIVKDEVSHMEAEGGHFANKLDDGSAREVRLVATGVELWK